MASGQDFVLRFPMREYSLRRSKGDSLTDGIKRSELKKILNNPAVNIYKKRVVILGCFSERLVWWANYEINQFNRPRTIYNLICTLKKYLLEDRTIIYFFGVSELRGKPEFFVDALNSIGNKLSENDSNAIIAKDMNEVKRVAFDWFAAGKLKKTNALVALESLPSDMIADLCDVCVVFVETESDLKEIHRFTRRGKLVIPVLLDKMERFQPLNSIMEAIGDIFEIKRKSLLLNSNNYETVAKTVCQMISLEKEKSETIASVISKA